MTPRAEQALSRLVERSRRITGARLPAGFLRPRTQADTPVLARLVQGGRGGEIRLKLYLSKVLLAGGAHKPGGVAHTIDDVSGPSWAAVLALPDPDHHGARLVASAQTQLEALDLIELMRRPGRAPHVRLLHPTGSGADFAEPGTPYLKVPLEFWTERWIWQLSALEVAVLLALIDLNGGRGGALSPRMQVRHLYGLSSDTWRIASAGLERKGFIKTGYEISAYDLDAKRRRKTYELLPRADWTTSSP